MLRRVSRVLTIISAGVLLAACGTTAEEPAATGTVRLLTHDSFALSDGVIADFEAATGLQLEIVKAGDAGTMVAGAVLAAGAPTADVLFGIDNTMLAKAVAANVFDTHETTGTVDGVATPVDYGDVCVNIDDAYFAQRNLAAPTSLRDLTKPAYRNLLVVEDPAASSPGLAFLLATRAAFAEGWLDYWKGLKANGVRVAGSWSDAYYTDFTKGGGNGRYPLVVSYATSPPAEIVFAEEPKPTTVSTSVMTDGCFRQIEYAGVLRGAKNPAGAKAVIDWLLSPAVQGDIPLSMFVFPAVEGTALPDVFVQFAGKVTSPLTLGADDIAANAPAWLAQWDAVMNA